MKKIILSTLMLAAFSNYATADTDLAFIQIPEKHTKVLSVKDATANIQVNAKIEKPYSNITVTADNATMELKATSTDNRIVYVGEEGLTIDMTYNEGYVTLFPEIKTQDKIVKISLLNTLNLSNENITDQIFKPADVSIKIGNIDYPLSTAGKEITVKELKTSARLSVKSDLNHDGLSKNTELLKDNNIFTGNLTIKVSQTA